MQAPCLDGSGHTDAHLEMMGHSMQRACQPGPAAGVPPRLPTPTCSSSSRRAASPHSWSSQLALRSSASSSASAGGLARVVEAKRRGGGPAPGASCMGQGGRRSRPVDGGGPHRPSQHCPSFPLPAVQVPPSVPAPRQDNATAAHLQEQAQRAEQQRPRGRGAPQPREHGLQKGAVPDRLPAGMQAGGVHRLHCCHNVRRRAASGIDGGQEAGHGSLTPHPGQGPPGGSACGAEQGKHACCRAAGAEPHARARRLAGLPATSAVSVSSTAQHSGAASSCRERATARGSRALLVGPAVRADQHSSAPLSQAPSPCNRLGLSAPPGKARLSSCAGMRPGR